MKKNIKAQMQFSSSYASKRAESPSRSASKPNLNSKGNQRGSLLQSHQKPMSSLHDTKIVRNHIEPKQVEQFLANICSFLDQTFPDTNIKKSSLKHPS